MAGPKNAASVVRKLEVVEEGGHHGGAWKVAYADFMTAMMAFFLLMWILSSSDEQKLRGIAEYFTNATQPGGSGVLDGATLGPRGTLNASNGSIVARGSELGKIDDPSPSRWEVRDMTNEPLGDGVAQASFGPGVEKEKAENKDYAKSTEAPPVDSAKDVEATTLTADAAQAPDHSADDARFAELQNEIMQAIQENPDLTPLAKSIIFERTPEGLRIQLIDQEGKPMFDRGGAKPRENALILMEKLGKSLARIPNDIVITGHTDAVPFADASTYDNWDLSTDRANAMRRVLVRAGVEAARFKRVIGKADTEPLVASDPNDPSNRRIAVLLRYQPVKEHPSHAQERQAEVIEAGDDAKGPEIPTRASFSAAVPDAGPKAAVDPRPVVPEDTFENLRNILR
ncbi:MAG: chemotaxis protein MotB [Alphaproteobacteria bacterium]|nr:MAG: chemotaxis protein MotB [Alphaproteobacteria bacterium]